MLRLVDLSSSPDTDARAATPPGVVIAFGPAADLNRAEHWLNTATFTLTEDACTDLRVVTVDSVPDALAELTERCQRWPHASAVCDDVLRGVDPDGPTLAGVVEALTVAQLDPSVTGVVLSGNGPSFCSGGDLAEFGTFADPASAHLARTRHSPALALDALTARLGRSCRAEVHGRVMGSGLEMAAFCGWVEARDDSVFGLPELGLGLIPGAGGTVSVTRRIGRWRTAYLVLAGHTVYADVALAWGLADAIYVGAQGVTQ